MSSVYGELQNDQFNKTNHHHHLSDTILTYKILNQRDKVKNDHQLDPPQSQSQMKPGQDEIILDDDRQLNFLTILPLSHQFFKMDQNDLNQQEQDQIKIIIINQIKIHLNHLFNQIVQQGQTYPQEFQLDLNQFENYFLSHHIFLGILESSKDLNLPLNQLPKSVDDKPIQRSNKNQDQDRDQILDLFILKTNKKNENESCAHHHHHLQSKIAGMYYIKPNYPGRSSHCCNGGFIVDPEYRGRKIGKALAKSYLHYAPLLGYRASVFNLVYSNNFSSIAIWDSLGFQRVGLIPQAGRLKAGKSTDDEEYVDAIIYWKRLV